MRFTPAIQRCADLGWLFKIEDQEKNRRGARRPVSHVYAIRGDEKIFISHLTEFIQMSRADFAAKLAALPREAGVA